MNKFDIPIFKLSYDLYKTLHQYRKIIPKHDRFSIFAKCEQSLLDILELIILASSQSKKEKLPTLKQASLKLNVFRIFVRLLKDVKALDSKKYIILENMADQIGRMLGGWIRSSKDV